MKNSSNNSVKPSDNGTKSKSTHASPTTLQIDIRGSHLIRSKRSLYSRQV